MVRVALRKQEKEENMKNKTKASAEQTNKYNTSACEAAESIGKAKEKKSKEKKD